MCIHTHEYSVQFSCSVVPNSATHGLQHARFPCPSPTLRACSNSWSLSWRCHPTISSSAVPFSSCLQSFPPSQFFASGGQSIGVLALASILPINIQNWFPSGLTGLISLQTKGLKSLLQCYSSKASILQHSDFFTVQLSTSHKILRENSFETKYQHPIPVNATKEIFSET